MKIISLTIIAFALAACGSGGGSANSEPIPPPVRNASPGGFWVGVDSDDGEVISIIGEDGLFYFLKGRFEGGTGVLSMPSEDNVTGILLLPQEGGLDPANNNKSTDCNLTGSMIERQSMTLDVKCKAVGSEEVLTTLALNYDARYERDSSLASIAGNYNHTPGMVLNIDANGSVFGQDAVSGCVLNGQASIINMAFNLYSIQWSNIGCDGQELELNGIDFFGLALLDNTVIPEQLIIAISSNIENVFVTVISFAERL